MQIPALTENGLDRCTRLHKCLQQGVLFGNHARTTRRTESGNLGVFQLDVFNLLEKFFVRRIARVGPAAFDIVKAKMVQKACNLQLVR